LDGDLQKYVDGCHYHQIQCLNLKTTVHGEAKGTGAGYRLKDAREEAAKQTLVALGVSE
jgi:dsRNA-specific ribonuclease